MEAWFERRSVWVVTALTVLGAALRLSTIDLQSYWFDEAFTVQLIDRDFIDMLDGVALHENTPPLYYAIAWAWARLFGSGEIALRSLSALIGTATIPVAYAVGLELRSRSTGLAAAALAATGPLLIWYSQEARAYALLLFLCSVSLLFFARGLRDRRRSTLLAWALVSALALATHYFALFLVGAEAAWLLLSVRTRRPAALPCAIVGGVAAALLPLALQQRSHGRAVFFDDLPITRRVVEIPKQLILGFDSPVELFATAVAALVVVIGVLLALRAAWSPDARGIRAALVLGFSAFAAPVVLAIGGSDYLNARNVIGAWLPLAVAVSAGLMSVRRGAAGVALLCMLGIASSVGVVVEPQWQRQDWRGIADAIGSPTGSRLIVAHPEGGRVPLQVYRGTSLVSANRPVAVTEIVAVAPISPTGPNSHSGPPPRPVRLKGPNGFRLVERRYTDSYSLVRLRSDRIRRVSPTEARGVALSPDFTRSGVTER